MLKNKNLLNLGILAVCLMLSSSVANAWNPNQYNSGANIDNYSVARDFGAEINDIDKKLDGVNKQLESFNNQLDGVNNQLDGVNNQLDGVNNQLDGVNNQLGNINNNLYSVDNRLDKSGASLAALAGLHTLDFDPDNKLDFAASYGHYSGKDAFALGAYYRPNEKTMFSVGTTLGNSENMYNLGVSFKVGKGNVNMPLTKSEMAEKMTLQEQEIIELRKRTREMEERDMKLEQQINILMQKINELMSK